MQSKCAKKDDYKQKKKGNVSQRRKRKKQGMDNYSQLPKFVNTSQRPEQSYRPYCTITLSSQETPNAQKGYFGLRKVEIPCYDNYKIQFVPAVPYVAVFVHHKSHCYGFDAELKYENYRDYSSKDISESLCWLNPICYPPPGVIRCCNINRVD